MSDLNHSLYEDFPQHAARIRQLKEENETFARLASEYHKLDHSVRGLEMRNVPTTDDNFEQMKRRRVQLKDQILKMLQ
ncbi:YdcH family protein [Marinobacterium rhizophilum]|uniref:YdcH family protein n=1 Tax=Marinobacterium rhizophilum TaxID=420402 RepID=A0ABY5HF62_9GAMM|nr:YdcH family protein [Marinobacterium rhizophilum]UTW10992.1 YdcH family protein [Marinobacterium rhizophilum]